MTSFKELQEKNEKDLIKLLAEKRTALRNFRFGGTGSKTRNVKEGMFLRKEIARVLTALKGKKS
ncbi:MAG: 50S ribosomal protein L29 [Patescibacteria group bacterium]|nr:50S ribosomal protein L29 [bacterium]MDZ4240796.1 50S ribosomal protein L29 [Patescibacteria group bacterium]